VVSPALFGTFLLSLPRFPHPSTIGIVDLAGTLVGCNDRRSDVAGVASGVSQDSQLRLLRDDRGDML
jgi:hypothetical protein